MALGSSRRAIASVTVSQAESSDGKTARIVSVVSGIGTSFNVTSVTSPNMPSDPTIKPIRSKPSGSGPWCERSITSPSASTTIMPNTCRVVAPCLKQWGPPELFATFPPNVHAAWLDGSGA